MRAARFWTAGLLGAVMIGVSMALVAWLAHSVALSGACSSTGYSNGRRVPECSGEEILRALAIFPSVLLGLLGLVVSGRRAPRNQRTGSLGVAAFGLGFLVLAGAFISSAWDPASRAVGLDRWGWAIPGFIFIPLGLAGFGFLGISRRRTARATRLVTAGRHAPAEILEVRDTGVTIDQNPRPGLQARPAGAPAPATATTTTGSSVADTLERLSRLRADGILTEAEFESAKARALTT